MYWSQMAQQGQAPDKALRAHTSTMVGNKMYVFGGCDRHGCWRGVATYNTGEGKVSAYSTWQADEKLSRQIRMYGHASAPLV